MVMHPAADPIDGIRIGPETPDRELTYTTWDSLMSSLKEEFTKRPKGTRFAILAGDLSSRLRIAEEFAEEGAILQSVHEDSISPESNPQFLVASLTTYLCGATLPYEHEPWVIYTVASRRSPYRRIARTIIWQLRARTRPQPATVVECVKVYHAKESVE